MLFGKKYDEIKKEEDKEICAYCDKQAVKEVKFRVLESPKDVPYGIPAKEWLCEEHLFDFENGEGMWEQQYE